MGKPGPAPVLLADGDDVERGSGVRSLPVTLLVDDEHRIALRFDGARDWTDEAFVRTYLEEIVDAG